MATLRFVPGISALGDAEERLRRGLDLTGVVGLSLSPENYLPVVITDDVTRPGCNTNRNRSFQAPTSSFDMAVAGVTFHAIQAVRAIIIDEIQLSLAENALPPVNPRCNVTVHFLQAGAAAPFAMATQIGSFTEGALTITERAPILYGQSIAAFGGVEIARLTMVHGQFIALRTRIHLPASAFLAVRTEQVAAAAPMAGGCTFLGRTA